MDLKIHSMFNLSICFAQCSIISHVVNSLVSGIALFFAQDPDNWRSQWNRCECISFVHQQSVSSFLIVHLPIELFYVISSPSRIQRKTEGHCHVSVLWSWCITLGMFNRYYIYMQPGTWWHTVYAIHQDCSSSSVYWIRIKSSIAWF